MAAALPPVTDCGCSCASRSSSSSCIESGACCPIAGVGDPNLTGVLPDDQTVRATYLQLVDLIAGPPVATWFWNPSLLVWQ